jgi:hypothetical protein
VPLRPGANMGHLEEGLREHEASPVRVPACGQKLEDCICNSNPPPRYPQDDTSGYEPQTSEEETEGTN